ncbi:MAG: LEA type 2 family protein [Chitinophagaceae bacterium]|nr:LEA type 2 family protein [Chitinophagaceae bacterium]MCW5928025.1 LEA type 2 family protein [Chitinophagaceae bacterium]
MTRSIFYCLLAAVLLSGCIGNVQEPEYIDVENIRVDAARNLTNLYGDIRFYNPNKHNLAFKSGKLDVYIEDRLLGKTVLDSLVKIRKLDTFLIPVKIELDTKNLLSNALSLAFKDSLKVRLDGKITIGRSGMFVTRPVRFETKEKIDILNGLW